jgi:hypothetical protein
MKVKSLALFGATLVMCAAWAAAPAQLMAQRRPGPLVHRAPFTLQVDSIEAHPAAMMAYIKGLDFKDSIRDADVRVLVRGRFPADTTLFIAQKAELAPEASADQAGGSWATYGQVMARITLWGDVPYPRLHLQPGVTYVAIRRSTAHSAGSLWAFMLYAGLSGDSLQGAVDSLPISDLQGKGPARFIVSKADDGFCTPCDSKFCCVK